MHSRNQKLERASIHTLLVGTSPELLAEVNAGRDFWFKILKTQTKVRSSARRDVARREERSEDWRADEKARFLGVGSCFVGEAAVCGGYSEASGTSGCFSETTGTDSKLSAEGTFVGGRSSDLGFGALWANFEPSGRLASLAVPLDGSEF
ncbi:hypothetical protein L2E82_15518 [Cichorium intybus]|uniref:Uncharacterized protein n=1 Tax=Cichorium intybus TaxID=13427 RepID=A0ACB9F3Y4_CICIN|nr:hypothetical protein L2E82_15518 [Cichorium intybus]